MKPRFGSTLRFCGVLVLVLAVSPVTAPFSTCDLNALFGGTVSHDGAVFQPKSTPDDPAAAPGGGHVLEIVRSTASPVRASAHGGPHRRAAFRLPLRI